MLTKFLRQKIGIDLGTSNTVISINDEIVLREPSVVAVRNGKVVAFGEEAKRMLGKTPVALTASKPIKHGAIADLELAEKMLAAFIGKARRNRKWRPFQVAVAIPSNITEVEKRAVVDCVMHAGAKEVAVIEESIAGAIGAGLPVHDAVGSFVVNIGGGTTEIAMMSLSGIVVSKSLRTAGDQFDEAISEYIKRNYNLMIGELTAENVKIQIGAVATNDEELSMEVRGRDLVTGLPRVTRVKSSEIQQALSAPVSTLVQCIKYVLEHCPPELSSDLVETGIMLTGGGALLRGLDSLIAKETSLKVNVCEDPIGIVATGIGRSLKEK